MQDDPRFSRMRIKTAEGNQVILDDANERIYISTCVGRTWIELDKDGHVNIYAAESISMRSGKDINFYADGNVNIEANKAVNIKANTGDMRLHTGANLHLASTKSTFATSCADMHIVSEQSLKLTSEKATDIRAKTNVAITADAAMDVKATGPFKLSSPKINLNAATARVAATAKCADHPSSPEIVPGHEPWSRPESSNPRGPNWKP